MQRVRVSLDGDGPYANRSWAFDEALDAYRRSGRPDQSQNMMEQLTFNAVLEGPVHHGLQSATFGGGDAFTFGQPLSSQKDSRVGPAQYCGHQEGAG